MHFSMQSPEHPRRIIDYVTRMSLFAVLLEQARDVDRMKLNFLQSNAMKLENNNPNAKSHPALLQN